MRYATGKHCVYYHRYHLVWSTKYRFKVLQGPLRLRVRDICRQVCAQNGVTIKRVSTQPLRVAAIELQRNESPQSAPSYAFSSSKFSL